MAKARSIYSVAEPADRCGRSTRVKGGGIATCTWPLMSFVLFGLFSFVTSIQVAVEIRLTPGEQANGRNLGLQNRGVTKADVDFGSCSSPSFFLFPRCLVSTAYVHFLSPTTMLGNRPVCGSRRKHDVRSKFSLYLEVERAHEVERIVVSIVVCAMLTLIRVVVPDDLERSRTFCGV